MNESAAYLIVTGSSIILLLGLAHGLYTFLSDKFAPRDQTVREGMMHTSPRLTRQTTMWKAWVGFNGSHSLGAVFFGCINLILTTTNFNYMKGTVPIWIVNILTLSVYLLLAKQYWFTIPFRGIFLALLCFIAAAFVTYMNP